MALKPMGTTPTRPQTSHPHPKPACLATPHWLRTVHRRTTISRRPWFRHSSPGSKCFAATTVRTIDHRRVHVIVLSATAAPAPAASPGSSIPGTAIQPRPMAETPPRKKNANPKPLRLDHLQPRAAPTTTPPALRVHLARAHCAAETALTMLCDRATIATIAIGG